MIVTFLQELCPPWNVAPLGRTAAGERWPRARRRCPLMGALLSRCSSETINAGGIWGTQPRAQVPTRFLTAALEAVFPKELGSRKRCWEQTRATQRDTKSCLSGTWGWRLALSESESGGLGAMTPPSRVPGTLWTGSCLRPSLGRPRRKLCCPGAHRAQHTGG